MWTDCTVFIGPERPAGPAARRIRGPRAGDVRRDGVGDVVKAAGGDLPFDLDFDGHDFPPFAQRAGSRTVSTAAGCNGATACGRRLQIRNNARAGGGEVRQLR